MSTKQGFLVKKKIKAIVSINRNLILCEENTFLTERLAKLFKRVVQNLGKYEMNSDKLNWFQIITSKLNLKVLKSLNYIF